MIELIYMEISQSRWKNWGDLREGNLIYTVMHIVGGDCKEYTRSGNGNVNEWATKRKRERLTTTPSSLSAEEAVAAASLETVTRIIE